MLIRLLILSLVICLASATGQNLTWDYFVFTQSWPVTTCIFFKCPAVPEPLDFVIHGLWPTSFPVEYPTGCPLAPPFNESLIIPILPELERKWPNLHSDSGKTDFWAHEWSKHGRCAIEDSDIPNELAFFNLSLQLHDRLQLLTHVKSAGFSPDNSSIIQKEDFLNQIRKQYGVHVNVTCMKRHNEPAYLAEVRLCMNPQLVYIDCVEKHATLSSDNPHVFANPSECPSEFILPDTTPATHYSLLYRVGWGLLFLVSWYFLLPLFLRP